MLFYNSPAYELWAPRIARLFLAVQFGIAIYFKLTGFGNEAAMTAAAGVPLSSIAVGAALILEAVGVIALLSGKWLRPVGLLLALYVLLLAAIFYHDWSNQLTFGLFVSHLGLSAALFYVSAYSGKPRAELSQ